MKNWKDLAHYAGFDWAKDHHAVVIVDCEGRIVADFVFDHSLEGWNNFAQKTSAWPNLAVAVETSQGAAVDQLLQREYTVYPVNPVAAQSYRERKAPSGTKTDHLDAWGLADAFACGRTRLESIAALGSLDPAVALACSRRGNLDRAALGPGESASAGLEGILSGSAGSLR